MSLNSELTLKMVMVLKMVYQVPGNDKCHTACADNKAREWKSHRLQDLSLLTAWNHSKEGTWSKTFCFRKNCYCQVVTSVTAKITQWNESGGALNFQISNFPTCILHCVLTSYGSCPSYADEMAYTQICRLRCLLHFFGSSKNGLL